MACGGGTEQMEADDDLAPAGAMAAPHDHEYARARPH